MATALASRKSKLVFETGDVIRERGKLRAVVIEIASPTVAYVRLKGTRTRFPFEWSAVYHMGAKNQAIRERNEKKAARKGGR